VYGVLRALSEPKAGLIGIRQDALGTGPGIASDRGFRLMNENEPTSLPENAYRPLKPGESFQPIIPAAANEPELTFRSILWGVILCIIFSIASAYSGLKVGQGMEAAIPSPSSPSTGARIQAAHLAA